MNYNKLILLLFFSSCLVSVTSAYYEVKQGDTVYLGETVDISRVLSWKMQFAFWKSGNPDGDFPEKIVEVTGFMYSYYIDPQKYQVGTWYKWDGKEENAGNMLAFYIEPGVRPIVTPTPTITPNTTSPTITPVPTLAPLPVGEHILIARGDYGKINYRLDSSKTINGQEQKAFIWLFGSRTKIMSSPLTYSKSSNLYSYEFSSDLTDNLTESDYYGFIQFVGQNNQQDVFYDPLKNSLDSPFKAIKPVNLDPFLPARIMHEFENMSGPSQYCDDYLVPVTMRIETPSIIIGDYWEDGGDIMIEGTTNMEEGTTVVAMIDPDNFALPAEIAAHKYATKTTGNYSVTRQYSIRVPLKWEELSIGQHTFKVSVSKYKIRLETFKDFAVTGLWVMPTPTPELKKVMVEEYGSHQLPTSTPTIITTPTLIPIPTPTQIQILVNGTLRNYTARNQSIVNPLPSSTTKPIIVSTPIPTATPIPVPTDDIVIPLNPLIVIGAIFIAGLILKKR